MGHDAWKGGVDCIQGIILGLKLLNTPWFKKKRRQTENQASFPAEFWDISIQMYDSSWREY